MDSSSVSRTSAAEVVIRPTKGWVAPDLGDLWRYRDLLLLLTWRDVSVRYKQTALGAAWAILQPVLTMVVLSIFFGHLAKVPSDGLPYPVFAFCALLPWQLFAHALTESSNSLVSSQSLITKVYFPRLIIPLAATLAGLVDFAVALVVLIGMMWFFGILPGVGILAVPLLVLVTITVAFAVGLWLSALNVQYRDVRYALPFLAQIWLFATPISYPSSLVPERWRGVYALNPMVGVVEGFRWALLGIDRPPTTLFAMSIIVALALLCSGLFYFRAMERTFADAV